MIQLNLVPEVKLKLIKSQRQRNLIIVISFFLVSISVGLVIITVMFVLGYQPLEISNKKQSIKTEFENLKDKEPELNKIVTLQSQLSAIDSSHENKLKTSRLIDILAILSSKNTDNAVTISSFNFSKEDNSISLTARTDKKGFDAAEIFKKNLEALQINYKEIDENGKVSKSNEDKPDPIKFASDVVLAELGTTDDQNGSNNVSFGLSFKYEPKVFSPDIQIESMKALSAGNVTDSYEEIPKNLFGRDKTIEGGNKNEEK